jgi:hypothetical protein
MLQTGLAVSLAALGAIVIPLAAYYGLRCAFGVTTAAADIMKLRGEWAVDDWNRRAILNQRHEAKNRFVASATGLAFVVLVSTLAFNFGLRGFIFR